MDISGVSFMSNMTGAGATSISTMNQKKAETDSFETALKDAQKSNDSKKLMDACKGFESYFIQTMYAEMRKTVGGDKDSLIPKGQAENMFQDMLDQENAKSATNGNGIGLAQMMFRQMSTTTMGK